MLWPWSWDVTKEKTRSHEQDDGEQHQKWLPHPCLLGGPKEGGNAMSPLHSRGSPTKGNKIRSGYLTSAFLGAQKRAEMLRHPCILVDPQRQAQGAKSEVAASPLPSRGCKRGRKCYVTLVSKRALTGPVEKKPLTAVLDSSGQPYSQRSLREKKKRVLGTVLFGSSQTQGATMKKPMDTPNCCGSCSCAALHSS